MRSWTKISVAMILLVLGFAGHGSAQVLGLCIADYLPADHGQRPASANTRILPQKFLRGFDPVTVYFSSNRGPGRGPADHGDRLLKISPPWPGAWRWLDGKTLQFKPSEPWPALAWFQVRSGKTRKILRTMMEAPVGMTPPAGSVDLKPFRTFTLTFSQPLDIDYLRKMLSLQIRALPGIESSRCRLIGRFSIDKLPRSTQSDPVSYAITLEQPVDEGQVLLVRLSLSLGEKDRLLWSARLSVRQKFQLVSIRCGSSSFPATGDSRLPRDMALACGKTGQMPQLVFSAPVKDLSLRQLKQLVYLDPAVDSLDFEVFGKRVALKGKFRPEVLYRIKLRPAPIEDQDQRKLVSPGQLEAFFYLGRKQPFVRWEKARAILEAKGPRMIPVVGFADKQVDLRIYRIDPLYRGLWPYPSTPLVVNEQAAPPFPGEEPSLERLFSSPADWSIEQNIRLLGSPLVSRIQELGLDETGSTTHLGIDIGPLLDKAVGRKKAGHYLVGIRRLSDPGRRSYMRVQVTDLSLTTVEERDKVVFFVRSLSDASAVANAEVVLEVLRKSVAGRGKNEEVLDRIVLSTDSQGRAVLGHQEKWNRVFRIYVRKGDDFLVIDPSNPPMQFANNHWAPWGNWLNWIQGSIPAPVNDATVGFVFTERPIYRPGDTVHIMGYIRKRKGGRLLSPGKASDYILRIHSFGGKEWIKKIEFSPLKGFSLDFVDKDAPTGSYYISLQESRSQKVVAKRNFRIEAYRIPKFEVQLVAPSRVPNDKPFEVKAVARYYAGGRVSNRPIRWNMAQRPFYHVPRGLDGYLFASSLQFSRQGRLRPVQSTNDVRTLDGSGADRFSADPSKDLDGSAKVYRFEATVTGVDNQLVSAVSEVKVLPAFVLGVKLKRYMKTPGTLKPKIIVLGVDDKPVKGHKVLLRLYRRIWNSHLRETDFTTGKASYVTDQQDIKIRQMELTSGKSPVVPSLRLQRAGVYVLELVSRDRLGRVQTLSADLFVGGKDSVAWRKSTEGLFSLSLDKKKYKPGQTARLVLKSPFVNARALVVIEQPDGNKLNWVDVKGSKAVVPIRISSRNIPNLPVHVVLMRGRIGSGGKDDSRYRPRTLAASKVIEVEPVSNKVKVEIELPKVARPGSGVEIGVRLSDGAGLPVSGEVTLWMVDEAVLSLAKESSCKPLDWLVRRNKPRTAVRDTRNLVVGRLEYREEPSGDGSDGRDKDRLRGKHRVRRNFKTVPYYKATLKVGRSGRIKVPVRLSDDLTSFQVRAVAASGMERFGYSHKRLKVRLPILVQPMLPRFARHGDRFMAGGVGRLLEGASGQAIIAMDIKGSVASRSIVSKTNLKKGHPVTSLVPMVAYLTGFGPGSIHVKMELERKSDHLGDAFDATLPVLPDREVEHVAFFRDLNNGTVTMNPLVEKPRPGSTRQDLLVSSSPELVKLLAATDYLVDYPHGCLEQRLSSVMAQVKVSRALKSLGLDGGMYGAIRKNAQLMLDELKVFQNDRGFFSFWPGGGATVVLTAQALEFMHMAKSLGLEVEQKMMESCISALRRVLRSDFSGLMPGYGYNQKTCAIRALGMVGELDDNYLLRLYHNRDNMDLSSGVDLAMAMQRAGAKFTPETSRMKDWLWDRVVFQLYQGKQVLREIRDSRTWDGKYLGSSTSTLAGLLNALSILDPENPKLHLLSDGLIGSASDVKAFGNTYDNSKAIEALLSYLDKAGFSDAGATVTIGCGFGKLSLGSGTKVAHVTLRSDKPLILDVKTSKPLVARVGYSYIPDGSGDQVKPRSSGLSVSRRTMIVAKDGGTPVYFEDLSGKQENVSLGDIVELQVTLVSERRMNHVALVVPFAAGLEPLNPALSVSGSDARPSRNDSISPSFMQRKDYEIRYYFTRLPKGTHSFYIRLRAATRGSFVHPAPWAQQMYHEQVRGRGAGTRIIVGKPMD